jgi:hypothetical protein
MVMSWSIYLGGPKEIILKELADAAAVINQAAETLIGVEVATGDSISVSVGGYVSWDEKGLTSANTSHNVSVIRYVPPAPPMEVAETVAAE